MHDCLDRLAHEARGVVVRTQVRTVESVWKLCILAIEGNRALPSELAHGALKHAEDRSRGVVEWRR